MHFKADGKSSLQPFNMRSYVDACTGALGVSRKVHLFSFYKGKIMDDLEKRKIYNLIQLALQAFQSNKYQIMERNY